VPDFETEYAPFVEAIGAILTLLSLGLVPGVVGWWFLTRDAASFQDEADTPSGVRWVDFTFFPIAPVISLSAFAAGLLALLLPYGIRVVLGPAWAGLLWLGFWGFAATLVSVQLWIVTPRSERRESSRRR
jgi:hypothetical protein